MQKLDLQPKFKNFGWKLFMNILPTKAKLLEHHLCQPPASPTCPLCGLHEETVDHLFLQCQEIQPIWFASSLQSRLLSFPSCWDLIYQLESTCNDKSFFLSCLSTFIRGSWSIWQARNKLIFNDSPWKLSDVIFNFHLSAPSPSSNPHGNPPPLAASPRQQGSPDLTNFDLILSCDAAFHSPGKASAGWAMRNSCLNVFSIAGKKAQARSPHQAEAQAIHDALLNAVSSGAKRILLCSDAQVLVNDINSKSCSFWECHDMLEHISTLSQQLDSICFLYIPRRANCLAHFCAAMASSLPSASFVKNSNLALLQGCRHRISSGGIADEMGVEWRTPKRNEFVYGGL